jgi:hypothetical protein
MTEIDMPVSGRSGQFRPVRPSWASEDRLLSVYRFVFDTLTAQGWSRDELKVFRLWLWDAVEERMGSLEEWLLDADTARRPLKHLVEYEVLRDLVADRKAAVERITLYADAELWKLRRNSAPAGRLLIPLVAGPPPDAIVNITNMGAQLCI